MNPETSPQETVRGYCPQPPGAATPAAPGNGVGKCRETNRGPCAEQPRSPQHLSSLLGPELRVTVSPPQWVPHNHRGCWEAWLHPEQEAPREQPPVGTGRGTRAGCRGSLCRAHI